jgi:alanyl-tRNA synthetase
MTDESTTALKEIAELLRRRVEQEDAVAARAVESSKRTAEISEGIKSRMGSMNVMGRLGSPLTPAGGGREDMQAKMETSRQEERQFKQSLLSSLEKHNVLLSEIIERLRT